MFVTWGRRLEKVYVYRLVFVQFSVQWQDDFAGSVKSSTPTYASLVHVHRKNVNNVASTRN